MVLASQGWWRKTASGTHQSLGWTDGESLPSFLTVGDDGKARGKVVILVEFIFEPRSCVTKAKKRNETRITGLNFFFFRI